jgi:hypothetical protein
MFVVRPATQLDVLDRRLTASGVRSHVVELEPGSLAAAALATDEGAAALISLPHLPADCRGQMT